MPLTALPLSIILNVTSGHHDAREVEGTIRAALDAAGRSYQIVVTSGADEVERAAREAVERSREHPQVIVAAGGDGTINLVAGIVLGSGAVFGVIPLGTFNYFARDLGIPLEPAAAAAALARGRLMPVHVARVNGHLFLNNASFGLYRRLLEEREGFKQRLGRYRIVAAAAGLATLWRFRDVYTVRMRLDGEAVTLRTPMLFFGLNSLQLENLDLEVAPCAQAGLLAVIALQPSSRWHLIGLALGGMLHGLRGSPDLRCYCASEVEVSVPGRRLTRVAVDGESVECELPLRFEVLRDALPVVVPREPEERR